MLVALLFVVATSTLQAASPEGADDPIAALVGLRIRVTDKGRGDRVSSRSFTGRFAAYDGNLVPNDKDRRTLPLGGGGIP